MTADKTNRASLLQKFSCLGALVAARSMAVLIFALITFCAETGLPATLHLSNGEEFHLYGYLEMLSDSDGTLTLNDILGSKQKGFTPLKGYVNRSYTDDTVWVRLAVVRDETFPADAFLRLWPPYLDHVEIFIQQGKNSSDPAGYRSYRMGDHYPAGMRPIRHMEFVVPFHLPAGEQRSIYIRLRTSSSLQMTGAIHTTNDLLRHHNPNLLLHGGYLAIALVIATINLIYFLRLRDRLYLLFSLYVICLFFNHLAVSGTISILLPDTTFLLSDYLVGMGSGLALAFFALFGMALFNTADKPLINLFLKLMIALGLLTALSVPAGHYNKIAPIQFFWSLLMILLLTGLSIRESFRKELGGRIYLAAFGVSNIAYAVQFMRLLGYVQVDWWNMYALQIGSTCNMVLMTLALTERLQAAEERILKSSRDAEQQAVLMADKRTQDLQEKQKELEEALKSERKALELKERFVAMINHEYRTPLAIIQANISILELRNGGTNPQMSTVFSKIRRAMDRLVEVLESSLAHERISGPDGKDNHQPILLESLFHGIAMDVGNIWNRRNFSLAVQPMPGCMVSGDIVLLRTAFLNLLDNAFKYSPSNKTVEMSVQRDEYTVTVCITDHGYGIPSDQIEKVFSKLHRVPGTSGEGNGIGLYLVRSVIEQHGGTITLSSSLNAGTTATTVLPLAKTEGNDG